MSNDTKPAGMWAVVELMGHVRLAGFVTEEERFGAKIGRIDSPTKDGQIVTRFFGGGSVYRITAVSEEVARQVALACNPAPIHSWEMPQRQLPAPVDDVERDGDRDDCDWSDRYDPSS